ncbi:hypothetical protein EMPG_10148 [Blastomyces silverae]|uniref:Mid2 domain-containing protein n=1 Tax=Blastomyces silverae TaxID=2060906 RepID=A0A0H1B654_9EURO|nr:hypothetical protein EMPG_10148 [Blastomyces silverae]
MAVTRTTLVKALAIFALLNQNFSVAEETEELPSWFNGYYIYETNGFTAVESITCRDSHTSWITSGTYANCCPTALTTRCPMPTRCYDSSVSFDNGGGYTCPGRQSCATMTIFETSPSGSPSATNIFCWENWSADTVYRRLPADATANLKLSIKPLTITLFKDSPTITPPPQTSQPPNLPTNNPQESDPRPSTPPPAPEKSRSNAGLIAGVTVGAVASVGILALVYFFYRRKPKKGAKALPHAAELDNTQGPAELDDTQGQAELQRLHIGGGGGQPKGEGYYGYAAGGDDGGNSHVHERSDAVKYPGYGGSPAATNASRNQNVMYEMPTSPG